MVEKGTHRHMMLQSSSKLPHLLQLEEDGQWHCYKERLQEVQKCPTSVFFLELKAQSYACSL